MARYRVNQGIDYPPNKRAEIGDIVEDLPPSAIKWLVADGYVELVEANKIDPKSAAAPVTSSEGEQI